MKIMQLGWKKRLAQVTADWWSRLPIHPAPEYLKRTVKKQPTAEVGVSLADLSERMTGILRGMGDPAGIHY